MAIGGKLRRAMGQKLGKAFEGASKAAGVALGVGAIMELFNRLSIIALAPQKM